MSRNAPKNFRCGKWALAYFREVVPPVLVEAGYRRPATAKCATPMPAHHVSDAAHVV